MNNLFYMDFCVENSSFVQPIDDVFHVNTSRRAFEKLYMELCHAAALPDPVTTTRQLMVLLEGTIVYGQAKRDPAVARAARTMAALVLTAA